MAMFNDYLTPNDEELLRKMVGNFGAVPILRAVAKIVGERHPVERLREFRESQVLAVAAEIDSDDDIDTGKPLRNILNRLHDFNG
jgi:hypothetical protein